MQSKRRLPRNGSSRTADYPRTIAVDDSTSAMECTYPARRMLSSQISQFLKNAAVLLPPQLHSPFLYVGSLNENRGDMANLPKLLDLLTPYSPDVSIEETMLGEQSQP